MDTVTPTQHRPWSRRFAGPALCCIAPLFAVACAKEPEKPVKTVPTENRIVSLAEVQTFMAQTRPPAPLPPPAPVEREDPPKPKPAPARRPDATVKAATRPKAIPGIATPAKSVVEAAPSTINANLVAPPAVAPVAPVVPLAPAPAPAAATTAVMNAAFFVDESRIYSKDDPEVVPARLLTTPGNSGISSENTDVNTMELVISKLGRVEEARLTVPPKRMTDMLLLSGAKMWKFTPAMKDGQPVRYRTRVSWETTK
jgi:hypothetical protein